MDCCNDPAVHTVTWMSSSQVGKTELLLNVIGYYIEHDPAPMLCIQPTQKPMAEDFSKDRLSTMIRDTPCLTGKVADAKARTSGNTILHKSFPGGHITIGGANSPAGLASRPIRVVLADEIDRYPESAGSEGDPLMLAEKRATTFWNRKKFRTSTPTVDGRSRIADSFDEGDKRVYLVPCPHCDERQQLLWSNVKFDMDEAGNPDLETVVYECQHCRSPIEHVEKRRMLIGGKWEATTPFTGHASFHISALYSPWVTWAEIVADWNEARGDNERMKVWTNTVLGETFKEQAKEIDHVPLLKRREEYAVPESVLVIVGSVDVQDDRLELLVTGWGLGEHAWHLEHRVFYGDTTQPGPWDDLEAFLTTRRYERDDGAQLRMNAVGVDSGHQTKIVYEFCKRSKHGRVFCLKGVGGERAITTPPVRTSKVPVPLFSVGVDPAKDIVFSRLEGDSFHFSFACDEEYFLQLTAEKAVEKKRRGFEYREWQKIRPRNEILDLWVYALATLYILNPNWQALAAPPDAPKEDTAPDPALEALGRRPKRRGGFIRRW